MPKSKSIEPEELIKFLDEYRFENPGRKVTIPDLGNYIRGKGRNVQDYTIRRCKELRGYLDIVNENSEEMIYNDLVTYQTIDADAFIRKNNSRDKLKSALVIRDQYYAKIAAHAADAIKRRKQAEKSLEELKEKVSELEKRLASVQSKGIKAEMKQKDEAIAVLKKLLDSYVYPSAANALLAEAGVLEVVNKVIPDELMKAKTIHADTEVRASKYASVNKLLDEFDD